MALAPEILPETPALVEALPALGMLCILVVCYGLIHGVDAFARALFGTVAGSVGWIPYLGNLISSPIHKIEQKIVSFLGGLERDIDSAIGHQFHNLSRVLAWAWHTFVSNAELVWQMAKFLSGFTTAEELVRIVRHFNGEIRAVEHAAKVAEQQVLRESKIAARTVAQGVYPRLRSLEHEVTRTIPREIKSARALAREAEDGVAKLWQTVRDLPTTAEVATAIAAAIAALGLSGLEAIRCSELGNLFGKWGCGLWNLLDGLFGLIISALALENVCTFLPLLESAFGDVAGPLIHLITEVPLGDCETPPSSWASLSVAAGPLPPAQTLGPLPS